MQAGSIPPARGMRFIHRETFVPSPVEATFAFFADASNLERLTPPWLQFRIQTPMPVVMAEGVHIDYRIKLHGLPILWRARIDVWEPGVRFVDLQIAGPYRWWHHEHLFDEVPGGTRVVDRVEYVPRVRWLTGAIVRRELKAIFDYRQATIRQLFQRGEPRRNE